MKKISVVFLSFCLLGAVDSIYARGCKSLAICKSRGCAFHNPDWTQKQCDKACTMGCNNKPKTSVRRVKEQLSHNGGIQ